MIHTEKVFKTVTEAKGEFFFWNFLAFSMIQWMLAILPLVPLPFLNTTRTSEVLGSCTSEDELEGF